MKSFNNFNLDTEILKSLDILDYKIPSQVQSRVIPVLLKIYWLNQKLVQGKVQHSQYLYVIR